LLNSLNLPLPPSRSVASASVSRLARRSQLPQIHKAYPLASCSIPLWRRTSRRCISRRRAKLSNRRRGLMTALERPLCRQPSRGSAGTAMVAKRSRLWIGALLALSRTTPRLGRTLSGACISNPPGAAVLPGLDRGTGSAAMLIHTALAVGAAKKTNLSDAIASRVRELRLAKGWSQERLADETGLSKDAVSRIERGDRGPRLDTLERIGGGASRSARHLHAVRGIFGRQRNDLRSDGISAAPGVPAGRRQRRAHLSFSALGRRGRELRSYMWLTSRFVDARNPIPWCW
jgi:transcriptional regulator with XRE-family HTH domain